eukprot:PITA_13389
MENDMVNTVALETSDGEIFRVRREIAMESKVIRNMAEFIDISHAIVPVYVSTPILEKVIQYYDYHLRNSTQTSREIKEWDENFISVDISTMRDIIKAADFLAMQSLLDLSSEKLEREIPARPDIENDEGSELVYVERSMENDMVNTVALETSDGQIFQVVREIAMESKVIKHMEEFIDISHATVPVYVSTPILEKVIQYYDYHLRNSTQTSREIKEWDENFISVDISTLRDIIKAADFLAMESLLDLSTEKLEREILARPDIESGEVFI